MRWAFIVIAFALAGCGSAPPQPKSQAKTEPAPAPPPVKDDTALLPLAHRSGARVVASRLLGIGALPGGSIGDYENRGRKYQLFIIEAESNQKAAFLLLDLRSALNNPEYIAYMGGYYGERNGAPIYGFAKLQYLAGVVGLRKNQADPIARELAARLR